MHTLRPIICLILLGVVACTPVAARYSNELFTDSSYSNALGTNMHVTTHATLFGTGRVRLQDTYLSPLDYSGPQLFIFRSLERPTRLLDSKVLFHGEFRADISSTQPRKENATYLGGTLGYTAAWLYGWTLSQRFKLCAGPQLAGLVGGLYNTRNGNNPAQVYLETNLGAALQLSYSLRIKHYPITISNQLGVPLLGAMFTPAYGQSYYEIFSLGHTDHNIRATHPFNAPSFSDRLTVDFPCRKSILRIGYLIDIRQSDVNNLRRHAYSQAFLIGWVRNICIIPPLRYEATR